MMMMIKRLIVSLCLGILIFWLLSNWDVSRHRLGDLYVYVLFAIDQIWPWPHVGTAPSQGCGYAADFVFILIFAGIMFVALTVRTKLREKMR